MEKEPNDGLRSASPESIAIGLDEGAETQRRFRYQAMYLALLAADMTQSGSEITDMWCEHGDDGLLRRSDGKLVGVQVKTTTAGAAPLTAADKKVVASLVVFCGLEKQYADEFHAYVLVSSIGFSSTRKDISNLKYVLALIADGATDDRVAGYVKRIADEAGVAVETARQALQKTRPEVGPGLDDIAHRLTVRVGSISELGDHDLCVCQRAARALADAIQHASDLSYEADGHDVVAFLQDPERRRSQERLVGKHLDASAVRAVMQAISATPLLAEPLTDVVRRTWPQGVSLAEKKMLAGGVPIPVVNQWLSLQHSYEAELLRWTSRYGETEARRRAAHIETIVVTEANDAYAECLHDVHPFGLAMLRKLQSSMRTRATTTREGLASTLLLTYEQLIGVLTLATQKCRVWWTKNLDFLEDDKVEA